MTLDTLDICLHTRISSQACTCTLLDEAMINWHQVHEVPKIIVYVSNAVTFRFRPETLINLADMSQHTVVPTSLLVIS